MTNDQSLRPIMITIAVYTIAGAFLIWGVVELADLIVSAAIGRE